LCRRADGDDLMAMLRLLEAEPDLAGDMPRWRDTRAKGFKGMFKVRHHTIFARLCRPLIGCRVRRARAAKAYRRRSARRSLASSPRRCVADRR